MQKLISIKNGHCANRMWIPYGGFSQIWSHNIIMTLSKLNCTIGGAWISSLNVNI